MTFMQESDFFCYLSLREILIFIFEKRSLLNVKNSLALRMVRQCFKYWIFARNLGGVFKLMESNVLVNDSWPLSWDRVVFDSNTCMIDDYKRTKFCCYWTYLVVAIGVLRVITSELYYGGCRRHFYCRKRSLPSNSIFAIPALVTSRKVASLYHALKLVLALIVRNIYSKKYRRRQT